MSTLIHTASSSEGDLHRVYVERRSDGSAWLEIIVKEDALGIDLDRSAVAELVSALGLGGAA